MKCANGTQNTRTLKSSKFQYFEDNCACEMCLYHRQKSKSSKTGCALSACCYADIKAAAIAAGRLNRPRGQSGITAALSGVMRMGKRASPLCAGQ
jgi:hypothetical protein